MNLKEYNMLDIMNDGCHDICPKFNECCITVPKECPKLFLKEDVLLVIEQLKKGATRGYVCIADIDEVFCAKKKRGEKK